MTTELLIMDDIGPDYLGMVGSEGIVLKLADADDVRVRINSPGGDVFEGLAIYNALASHHGHVEVVVEGLAASAASLIAMAGDRIVMRSNSLLMIHNAWLMVAGNAVDLREAAELLDKIDSQLAATYSARTGNSLGKIKQLLAAETWLTADEAKAQGFCDEVAGFGAKAKVPDGRFKNVPRGIERIAAKRGGYDLAAIRRKAEETRKRCCGATFAEVALERAAAVKRRHSK